MKSHVPSWLIYNFGSDNDRNSVDEVVPTGAHSPPKYGVCATSSVSPTIFSVLNLPLSIEHHYGKQIEVHCHPQSPKKFKKSDLPGTYL